MEKHLKFLSVREKEKKGFARVPFFAISPLLHTPAASPYEKKESIDKKCSYRSSIYKCAGRN